jgi:hypothetical protein
MTYYYESANFAGQWRPRISPRRPSEGVMDDVRREKWCEGFGPRIRHVVKIDQSLAEKGAGFVIDKVQAIDPVAIAHIEKSGLVIGLSTS